MNVEPKILKTWDDLKDHGDFTAIAEKYNVSRDAVAAALKTGECTSEVFIAMNNFYAEKKAAIEESKAKLTS